MKQRRLIKLPEVCSKTGLSRAGVYKRMNEGAFPSRVPLGGRAVAWIDSEVDEWIENQISRRDDLSEVSSDD